MSENEETYEEKRLKRLEENAKGLRSLQLEPLALPKVSK